MNNKQIAIVLNELHHNNMIDLDDYLSKKLRYFNIPSQEFQNYVEQIKLKYTTGIKSLNKNQLKNLVTNLGSGRVDKTAVKSRLNFYEIDVDYHDEIIMFLENLASSNKSVDVTKIDSKFKGVQVASRDDFNMILNQGYTGDWVLSPNSIKHSFVQVASMNETGMFPRGHYLNAEITNIEPIAYGEQTRYRIHIKNPIVIDSGNRNVKFKMNPVTYIN